MSYLLKEVNEKLLKLFGENGEHWTKDAYARTKDGLLTSVGSGVDYSFLFIWGFDEIKNTN